MKLRAPASSLLITTLSLACLLGIAPPARAQTAQPPDVTFTSPAPGSTLPGSTVTFTWPGRPDTAYFVQITNSRREIVESTGWVWGQTEHTSSVVPTDGRTVRVVLAWWRSSTEAGWGEWTEYTAAGTPVDLERVATTFTSPAEGSTLPGSTVTFTWPGRFDTAYFLQVANSQMDIVESTQWIWAQTEHTSNLVPTDGQPVFVRVAWWRSSADSGWGEWHEYTAAPAPPPDPALDPNATPEGYCPSVDDAVWDADARAFELELLEEINRMRKRGESCDGVDDMPAAPPLTMDSRLHCAARNHSKDEAVRDYFGHTSPDGVTVIDRAVEAGYPSKPNFNVPLVNENITAQVESPAAAVDVWMKSRNHCETLMSPDYNHFGAGFFSREGSTWTRYWTAVFGDL